MAESQTRQNGPDTMPVLLRLLARLPLPVLYVFASLLAPLLRHLLRYRRRTVRHNLRAAFPEWTDRELRHTERGFYRHLCDVAVETLWSTRASARAVRARVHFEGLDALDEILAQRTPALILTLHQGNWEWLLNAVCDYLPCPLDAVYKPLHDTAIDTLLRESRGRFGGNPITFADAAREMLRRRREFRMFAMAADQAPFKKDKRHWTPFFGRPAAFYLGPQKIAEAARYPVLFVCMRRLRRGQYSAHFELLAKPPYTRGGSDIIERYASACERTIRHQPDSWLWSHNKWKHSPPTAIQQELQGSRP